LAADLLADITAIAEADRFVTGRSKKVEVFSVDD
jgi:hypothetical protein